MPESSLAIEGISAVGGHLFVSYLDNVVTHVKKFDADGKSLGDLKLPGIGSAFGPRGRWKDDEAFYSFTSFVEPAASYRFAVSTGKQDVWFSAQGSGAQRRHGDQTAVWYTSKDGTKVPMFPVSRKGWRPTATCRCCLPVTAASMLPPHRPSRPGRHIGPSWAACTAVANCCEAVASLAKPGIVRRHV